MSGARNFQLDSYLNGTTLPFDKGCKLYTFCIIQKHLEGKANLAALLELRVGDWSIKVSQY